MAWISLCVLLACVKAEDVVSTPKRVFGLGNVLHVAISGDGRFMASGGQGGGFLWDVEDVGDPQGEGGTLRKRLEGEWAVTALAFSPRSNILAGASVGRVVLWDAETGERVRELAGHAAEVTRLQFSPDGSRLVSASADNFVRVWAVETGEEEHSVRVAGSPIVDVAISPDGGRLATVDTFLTNAVKIWDIATETQLRAPAKTNWPAQRCVFTPEGNLVTTAGDRTVLLWDGETGEEIRSFEGVTGAATIVTDVWMAHEDTLAAVCTDGRIYLWNFASGELVHVVDGEHVLAAAGVPNDFRVVCAGLDHAVRMRQLPGGDTVRTFKGHTTSVHSGVAISPDGRFVLSGGTEALTRLWDRKTGEPVREFAGSGSGTMAAVFSPNGSNVLTTIGLPNPAVQLWRTDTGELEREFGWAGSWPMGAVFSPDGTMIAVHEQIGNVRIFNTATGTLIRTLGSGAFGGKLAFAPAAPLLATTSDQSSVALFDYETGRRLHTFSLEAGPVSAVEFSPDGETLLVAWSEGGIRLFDAATYGLKRELPAAAAFLEAAKYSPDGQYILTGEGWPLFSATLWEVASGERVRTFGGHQWVVSALGFSADGASVVTGADRVREWSIVDLAARLRIEKVEGEARLSWAFGELEHATGLGEGWQIVTNASSPFYVPLTKAGYFRVHVEESEQGPFSETSLHHRLNAEGDDDGQGNTSDSSKEAEEVEAD